MSDLNPLTLGDNPEDFIELEDGSVEVMLEDEAPMGETGDFLENLAEALSAEELNLLGTELVEQVERDKKSREKRDKQYEEGLRRTGLGDDAPGGAEFDGASRVVHPVLAEACVDFSSRAIKELFPASGPVKPWVQGDITPNKLEKANRKTRFMNWQLTTQIKEYRDELEQLLTQLPMGGSQYQKFWYDERKKRVCSEFVPVDEVFLPFAATNFYTAPRVTHRQLISRTTFRNRVQSGLYRDVFLPDVGQYPEESATARANDKIEGREEDGYNEDGLRAILEIYCWQELTSDEVSKGSYAPYIITIDEDTEKVLSIYRNWAENDSTFQKLEWMVEWKFIPWRGAYAIGLPHLIGGLSAALTGTLRALLDSAHINNAPTMLKLKSGRIVGQNTQVNVTQVCDIEGPAGIDDIKKLAMPMPFNPPSPVLHQLMQDLYGLAKGVVATAEEKINQIGDRTPVGTTMALIEQGSNTYSAIHSRLHESQKRALEIVHRLNATYLDEADIPEREELTISRDDFSGTLDIIPVSDPTIFSEAQRFAQSQAILQMATQDAQNPNIPWNQVAVRRRMLKQMRIDNIDELLPPEQQEITSDVLTENTRLLKGDKLKAGREQDHLAHILGHLNFMESPLQSANPMVPPQLLLPMFGHMNEHLQMLLTAATQQAAESLMAQGVMAGEDALLAQATQEANARVTQQFASVLQRIEALQQQLQQRIPQPQPDPSVQASIQIAQMDIQRKQQLDQATLQMRQAEAQFEQQLQQARMQMEQQARQVELQAKAMKDQAELQLRAAQLQQEAMNDAAKHQVTIQANTQDNLQKQQTEVLKNRDDNETKLVIERVKAAMGARQLDEQLTQQTLDMLKEVLGSMSSLQPDEQGLQ